MVAGLPNAIRALMSASQELSPEKIIIVGADAAFMKRWAFQIHVASVPVMTDHVAKIDPHLPILAIDSGVFPDEGGLTQFVSAASNLTAGGQRRLDGHCVATYTPSFILTPAEDPSPSKIYNRLMTPSGTEVSVGGFLTARSLDEAQTSAQVLYRRLIKENDGYLARFDRHLSVAITRLLLPFPIAPNHVTAVSLVLGLIGAWWLAYPSRQMQFIGALTLWFCCLLDGCDGEIARLKYHSTPWGGQFDLMADHIAHLATFIALPIGVARLHPHVDWWIPGSMLVTGFIACGYSVWWLVLRIPTEKRGPAALIVERIASRDYIYIILALTAIGHLDWFVWAAALGSHVFWIWLWWTLKTPTLPA
jgi:phosphatidylglycerophosphate synthase